jgi:hypothetical protein
MRKSTFRICCAIVGVCCLVALVHGLIDSWTRISLLHKVISILAILGWVDINYKLIYLRYHWMRHILGEE